MKFYKTFIQVLGLTGLAVICAACDMHAWRVSASEGKLNIPSYYSKKESIIYFTVPQREEPSFRPQLFATMMEKALTDNPTFGRAVQASSPPDRGLYVSIRVQPNTHLTFASTLYLLLSSCTLTAIPFYTDEFVEYAIVYELYRNGEPVEMYQHHVQQKTLIWLLAAPIFNDWLTDPWGAPKEKVFAETAALFWLDGHRDGFF